MFSHLDVAGMDYISPSTFSKICPLDFADDNRLLFSRNQLGDIVCGMKTSCGHRQIQDDRVHERLKKIMVHRTKQVHRHCTGLIPVVQIQCGETSSLSKHPQLQEYRKTRIVLVHVSVYRSVPQLCRYCSY
jgi:hypothetical protein